MPSTRPVRCTTLAPMAVGVRSCEPTALCIVPSHEPTREGRASGFVGRAIASPACVARGHRLDRVSPVTGGWSCSIVTCLAGYPCAFRKPHRGWHLNSMSSHRLRRATATGLRHAVSIQPGCSQPRFTSPLQLAPSCYPSISRAGPSRRGWAFRAENLYSGAEHEDSLPSTVFVRPRPGDARRGARRARPIRAVSQTS